MTTATAAFAPDDLRAIAERMRDLDICMLTTRTVTPSPCAAMSNNGQVELDGDTRFFAERDSAKVRQIEVGARGRHRVHRRPSTGRRSRWTAEAEIVRRRHGDATKPRSAGSADRIAPLVPTAAEVDTRRR